MSQDETEHGVLCHGSSDPREHKLRKRLDNGSGYTEEVYRQLSMATAMPKEQKMTVNDCLVLTNLDGNKPR